MTSTAKELKEALEQALWHIGNDVDRALLSVSGVGWKTDTTECAAQVRAALSRLAMPAPTAEFVKQHYGAIVATILEAEDSVVEVMERNDGVYGLIIHHRRHDRDQWDDLSAYLKPEHFELLGSVAATMRTTKGTQQ